MNKSILTLHNQFFLFFSAMGLFLGLSIGRTIYPFALYSLMLVVLFVIFLSFYRFSVKLKPIQFVLLLMLSSLLVKVFAVLIFENIMLDIVGIPFLSYKDDYVYNDTSSRILSAWSSRGVGFYRDIQFSSGFYSGYPNISALAKMMFGDSYLVPRFLNVFFSTLTIPVFFATIRYFSDKDKLTKLAAILFAFSPAFIVYASLQLKETVLIFFVATLIYGTVNFFSQGISLRNITLVAISMGALLFFRAATLLPYLVAIVLCTVVSKRGKSNGFTSALWVLLVIVCFYFIWEYLYNSGLLSLTGEEYFQSRMATRGEEEAYQGTNDLSRLGIIAILLGPLLAVLSLFLPAPVYMDLDQLTNVVPYHYFPLLGYYAILPMVSISLIYLLKNYRVHKIGVFIISFLILYKIGQAGGKSILDSRQSLPAIYAAYLLLAYFDLSNPQIDKLWRRYRIPLLIVLLAVMFILTFLRYVIRS